VPSAIKGPVLLHTPPRQSVACCGAVRLRTGTGTVIRSWCATFNAATFETFLKTLLRHRSRDTRMVLVLGNARDHHAGLGNPWLRKYRAVLTLLFLPADSPQLAPVERFWKLARRLATHNRFFATLDDVLTAVALCFDRWRTPDSVLRRLCGRSEDAMFNGSSSPIPTATKAADRPTTPSTPLPAPPGKSLPNQFRLRMRPSGNATSPSSRWYLINARIRLLMC
jgi:transposase